jgi:hypothetical protein
LSEDDQVGTKHVAVGCNFNVILNEVESVNRVALKAEVNVESNTSMQQGAEIQYYLYSRINSLILVGKPEGKRPLRRPRCRSVENMKMDLREIG